MGAVCGRYVSAGDLADLAVLLGANPFISGDTAAAAPDATVKVEVMRNGADQTVELALGKFADQEVAAADTGSAGDEDEGEGSSRSALSVFKAKEEQIRVTGKPGRESQEAKEDETGLEDRKSREQKLRFWFSKSLGQARGQKK